MYDDVLCKLNRKIDKIRQKALISPAQVTPVATQPNSKALPLNAEDSEELKKLINVRQSLIREKAMVEEQLDVISKTDRDIKSMHFRDSNQVKQEIEEAKKQYLKEKTKYDEVLVKKTEIASKIEQFKQRFHEQRRQTLKHQEMQAKLEKGVKHVVE